MNHYARRTMFMVFTALSAVCAAPAWADDHLAALEARVAQLEAAAAVPAPVTDRLKINGFMSAGFAKVDAKDFSYEGLTHDVTHDADSILGVQIAGAVNDDTHAVVQLTARGSESFAVEAEWAYIGMRTGAQDEVRVGRQRYPFFMLSEYLEVGYSYPWAKPPVEVYQTTMPSSFDGVAWKHTLNTGDWSHDLQTYWGSSQFLMGGGEMLLHNSVGLGAQSTVGNWLFSASYSQGEVTLNQSLFDALASMGQLTRLDGDIGWFAGLGVQYDNGALLLMAEATQITVDGFFPDSEHVYATLGYRFGKVMPHVTWSAAGVRDGSDRPANPAIPALCGSAGFCMPGGAAFPADTLARLLNTKQDSVTLGVRYDLMKNIAVKADWTRVLDTHNTFGYFSRHDGNLFTGAFPGEDVDVWRAVVDVVF
jgi:hypothetical protein